MSFQPLMIRVVAGLLDAIETHSFPQRFPHRVDIDRPTHRTVGYWVSPRGGADAESEVETLVSGRGAGCERMWAEYALVSQDKTVGTTHVLTDELGAFPLFVCWAEGGWWISTSLREVALRAARRTLDLKAVVQWISGERNNGTATLFHEIREVPAGAAMRLGDDGSWWLAFGSFDPPATAAISDPGEAADAIVAALEVALRDQAALQPDVPLAIDLTSGVDSALLAYLAQRLGYDVRAFSMVRGPEDADCRASVVTSFAARHGISHRILDVSATATCVAAGEEPWQQQSPEAVGWPGLDAYLSSLAESGHTLRITGEGGDEILSAHLYRPKAFAAAFSGRHQNRVARGLFDLFTPQGVRLASAAGSPEPVAPSFVPAAAIRSRRALFPAIWRNDVWALAPYLHPAVRAAASSLPPAVTNKHQLWKHRSDIFLPAQLKSKVAYTGPVVQTAFPPSAVERLLQSSLLSRAGLIDRRRILARCTQLNSAPWLDSATGTWLWRILAIEAYLQSLGNVELETIS